MFNKLKTSLEEKAGLKLDSLKDCRKMEQILYERGFFVSYTTLSRIFSIAKISAKSRRETLNLLSSYLDFNSYDHFLESSRINHEKEEQFIRRSLDIKSKLLLEKYDEAIDGLNKFESDNFNQELVFKQLVGKNIFSAAHPDQQLMSMLLNQDLQSGNIAQHFIYEDDPRGHFQWSLENLTVNLPKNEDRHQLEKLYIYRKKLLKGLKVTGIPAIEADAHYELFSRYLELQILKATAQKSILSTLDLIINIAEKEDDQVKLSYAARACRGLLYLKNLNFLRKSVNWRNFCLAVFENGLENPADKAFIFALLKIVYNEKLPLSFYKITENSSIESMMMLALAFDEEEAVENYKKYLRVMR